MLFLRLDDSKVVEASHEMVVLEFCSFGVVLAWYEVALEECRSTSFSRSEQRFVLKQYFLVLCGVILCRE